MDIMSKSMDEGKMEGAFYWMLYLHLISTSNGTSNGILEKQHDNYSSTQHSWVYTVNWSPLKLWQRIAHIRYAMTMNMAMPICPYLYIMYWLPNDKTCKFAKNPFDVTEFKRWTFGLRNDNRS